VVKEKEVDESSTEVAYAMRHLLFSRFDECQVGKSDEIHLALLHTSAGWPSQTQIQTGVKKPAQMAG
jgi:hypothetical protein